MVTALIPSRRRIRRMDHEHANSWTRGSRRGRRQNDATVIMIDQDLRLTIPLRTIPLIYR